MKLFITSIVFVGLLVYCAALASAAPPSPSERERLSKESEQRIKAEQKKDDEELQRHLNGAPASKEEIETRQKDQEETVAKLKVHPTLEKIAGPATPRGDLLNAVALIRMNEESLVAFRKKGKVSADDEKMITESLFPMIRQILPKISDEQIRDLFKLGSKKLITK